VPALARLPDGLKSSIAAGSFLGSAGVCAYVWNWAEEEPETIVLFPQINNNNDISNMEKALATDGADIIAVPAEAVGETEREISTGLCSSGCGSEDAIRLLSESQEPETINMIPQINNNNDISNLEKVLATDGADIIAVPAEAVGETEREISTGLCSSGCGLEDAINLSPDPLNHLVGVEINGLETTFEDLCDENITRNAKIPDEDEMEQDPDYDAFDEDPKNPQNKTVEILMDECLRWHEKTMINAAPGTCMPYDFKAESSFKEWVDDADRMFRERKFEDLREKFKKEYRKTKGKWAKRDPQLCWRMARLTFLMGNEVENNQLIFWKESMIYAIEAIRNFEDKDRLKRNPDVKEINHACCWKCHLWFGIVMAKLGGMQADDTKRIRVAFMAKQHIERAIEINPLDPIPNFALAKWHYEFCKLSAGQGKIVQRLGYPYPVTEVKKALEYAERANELAPKLTGSTIAKFPRNCYLLAELYWTLGQKEKAERFINALIYQLGPFCVSQEDRRAVERAKLLNIKLKNPVPRNPNPPPNPSPRAAKARPVYPNYPEHHNNLFEQPEEKKEKKKK